MWRGERGAYAVLFAIMLLLFVSVGAFVVDISDAEVEIRAHQTRTDFAALAAAANLPGDPAKACEAAWSYVKTNTPGLAADPDAQSPCASGIPQTFSGTCESSTPAVDYQALNEAPYEITFTFPVTDGHPVMEGWTGKHDGVPCERFAVSVVSNRTTVFSSVLGFPELRARASAVGRGFHPGEAVAPVALVVFDPIACVAIDNEGQGKVWVYPSEQVPGWIGVDSDGSDGSCGYTVDVQGGGGGKPPDKKPRIWACGVGSSLDPVTGPDCRPGGHISLYAFTPTQTRCDDGNPNACQQSDVNPQSMSGCSSGSCGLVFPTPIRLTERLTRAPIDHRYNCKPNYPAFDYFGYSLTIDGCAVTGSPHVDNLRAYMDSRPDAAALVAAGWGDAVAYLTSQGLANGCQVPTGTTVVFDVGNWVVDCETFVVQGNVKFRGGNIVFQGGLHITGQAVFSVNEENLGPLSAGCEDVLCPTDSGTDHAYIFIRANKNESGRIPWLCGDNTEVVLVDTDGDGIGDTEQVVAATYDPSKYVIQGLKRDAQTTFTLNNTAVYIDHRSRLDSGFEDWGCIEIAGGDKNTAPLTWTAPLTGPLEDLDLWSESRVLHKLQGQAQQEIEGTMFMPFAFPYFRYAGGGVQNQARAQFLAYRLNIEGQGELIMQVDPDRQTPFPHNTFMLIR